MLNCLVVLFRSNWQVFRGIDLKSCPDFSIHFLDFFSIFFLNFRQFFNDYLLHIIIAIILTLIDYSSNFERAQDSLRRAIFDECVRHCLHFVTTYKPIYRQDAIAWDVKWRWLLSMNALWCSSTTYIILIYRSSLLADLIFTLYTLIIYKTREGCT